MTVNAPTEHAPYVADTAAAIARARRAAIADRYAIDSFVVEWRKLTALADIADEWRELAARALVPNVFYEPAFALAAAPLFGRDAGAVLVWSGTMPRKLLGFFPARIETRRYGLRLPVLVGWTHPFAPLGVPLVEREAAEPVIAAWLAHLAGSTTLPGLLLLPLVPEDGAFAAALSAVIRRAQMPTAQFNPHSRALLAPQGERSGYVEHALGPRKFRELRRNARRLGEAGAPLFVAATEPTPVAAAIEDFLALEASGWKGQARTAAACDEAVGEFVKTAVGTLAVEHKAEIDRILLDGRPIAASITLRSGSGAWFWKIAYDETWARFAPGVLLTAWVTERLADDLTLARTDSCATADHAVMNRIWSERLPVHDLLLGVRPRAPFASATRLEGLRLAAIAAAKATRQRLRGYVGLASRSLQKLAAEAHAIFG
jgi:CelD/BcsL family acetyltransferase involved in cellulose biosynthesis